MKTLKYTLLLILIAPLFAVDTLHCIANYEFQTPMDEAKFMSVRMLGDVNADGYDDWAFIFHDNDTFYTKDSAWVFFGSDSIDFTQDHALKAYDINSVGDVNNDGYDDIAYLVVDISNMYIMSVPKLYVLHGGPAFDFIPDDTCAVMAGGQHVDFSPIGTLGDINGDGFDDIYCGVSFQLNSIGKAKQYLYFGSNDISISPDIILNPPTRIDTIHEMTDYSWGWCYAPLGDLDVDGFDDFSVMYRDVPSWSEESRVIYLYRGDSDSDSIIASADTLVEGFYTDFYQMGNIYSEGHSLLLHTQYYFYLDIFSVENREFLTHFNAKYECIRNKGDLNDDGYNDWFIHSSKPIYYQGYYGNVQFDTIPDFALPVNEQPEIHTPGSLKCVYIGDVCGDGYDKLLFIERSNDYHVYCYSYNDVVTSTELQAPADFTLSQNYPNPFNPITTIGFDNREFQHIKLQVFDITGRLITTLIDGFKEAGHWDIPWNAGDQSSGIYIYRLICRDRQYSRKMLLMK